MKVISDILKTALMKTPRMKYLSLSALVSSLSVYLVIVTVNGFNNNAIIQFGVQSKTVQVCPVPNYCYPAQVTTWIPPKWAQLPAIAGYSLVASLAAAFGLLWRRGTRLAILGTSALFFALVGYEAFLAGFVWDWMNRGNPYAKMNWGLHVTNLLPRSLWWVTNGLVTEISAVALVVLALPLALAWRRGT